MRAKDDGGALFTSVSAEPERPLARVLDAASRRDFIYLVLLLALVGKSHWFLLLAGLGAPIYFCLVRLPCGARAVSRHAKPFGRLTGKREPDAAARARPLGRVDRPGA